MSVFRKFDPRAEIADAASGPPKPPKTPKATAETPASNFRRFRCLRWREHPDAENATPAQRSPIPATDDRFGTQSCGAFPALSHAAPERPAPAGSGGVPDEWVEGVARLRAMPVAPAFIGKDWSTILSDAERFLAEWGAAAALLGWPDWALWGVQRHVPNCWRGRELVALLGGCPVVALTAAEAVIDVRPGVRHVYRRPECDPLHPAERCLLWELETLAVPGPPSSTATKSTPRRVGDGRRVTVHRYSGAGL